MNLTRLMLENFGKFENFECNLMPGLNIIKGANETGKSTLVTAISALLYGDPESGGKNISESKTWGSDKSVVLKAGISDDNFYGILEKDFNTGQINLKDEKLNISITDKDKISEIISGSIGFRSVELFEATSCIKQGEMTSIGGSVEEIKSNLESLVTGGEEDLAASQIISRIGKRIDDITRQDNLNPGILMKHEEIQRDLDYNIEKITREISNIQTWRSSLAQVRVAYSNVVDDLKLKKEKLETSLKAEKVRLELNEISGEKNNTAGKIRQVKSSDQKIKDLKDRLYQVVEVSAEDSNRIEELESTIKYLRPKQTELENDIENYQQEYDSFKVNGGLFGWVFLSLGIIGYAVADYLLGVFGFYLQAGGIGLISLMVSMILLSRLNQKRAFLKERLNTEKQKLESVQNNIDQSSYELKELLTKYQIGSFDEVAQAKWKRSDLEKQLSAEEENHKGFLEGCTIEEFEVKLQDLEKKEFDSKIALENFNFIEPVEMERLKLIVDQLEEQKNTLKEEIKSLSRQIETAEGGAELRHSYAERKEYISGKKVGLVEELATLSLTKECIEKARQNVMISTLELLENRTSEILELITDGKYNKVRFEKSSLKFEVYSEKKNDWVDPHGELSQETVEQVYLTARLALTEILANDVSPPIILDDPFNSFDLERRENTMKLLKEMSEKRQVLLLTTDDDYDRWADNTVQL